MPSVSKAVCLQQRPSTGGGRRAREAGRRSVAAPRARHSKPKAVHSGGSESGRGQHCSPPKAVAAPTIPATEKVNSSRPVCATGALSSQVDSRVAVARLIGNLGSMSTETAGTIAQALVASQVDTVLRYTKLNKTIMKDQSKKHR